MAQKAAGTFSGYRADHFAILLRSEGAFHATITSAYNSVDMLEDSYDVSRPSARVLHHRGRAPASLLLEITKLQTILNLMALDVRASEWLRAVY